MRYEGKVLEAKGAEVEERRILQARVSFICFQISRFDAVTYVWRRVPEILDDEATNVDFVHGGGDDEHDNRYTRIPIQFGRSGPCRRRSRAAWHSYFCKILTKSTCSEELDTLLNGVSGSHMSSSAARITFEVSMLVSVNSIRKGFVAVGKVTKDRTVWSDCTSRSDNPIGMDDRVTEETYLAD